MGGDTQPRPITSPDRPGLPDFSRETLKNMGRPGYEASPSCDHFHPMLGSGTHTIVYFVLSVVNSLSLRNESLELAVRTCGAGG